jgi:hypothetical protein
MKSRPFLLTRLFIAVMLIMGTFSACAPQPPCTDR